MALDVIGAGWGRTGTESLKEALEILGYGRCYHMFELLKRTRHVPRWEALSRGERPDYEDLFRGFRSGVDFPIAKYYRELAAEYPNAKVILSVREPSAWYRSASKTILRGVPRPMLAVAWTLGLFSPNLRGMRRMIDWIDGDLFTGFFEGRMKDEAYITARFVAWNEEVKRTIAAERLLVYEVKDGWEPLCAFLGVPVPSVPFPRNNDSESFDKRTSITNVLREFWSGADP